MTEKKCCGCGALANFTLCNDEEQSSTTDIEVVMDSPIILPADQILIIRDASKETRVYKASWNDLSPETALLILSKVVLILPRTDPSDGRSLWVDEGFIRIASGDPGNLGSLSPTAMRKSLGEAFKILPTSDPGDGSPWLNGGVLMQGSNNQ